MAAVNPYTGIPNNPNDPGPAPSGGPPGPVIPTEPLPTDTTTPPPTPGDTFETPQSPSQGAGLGAYDVWANQAFGGATDPEAQVFGGTYRIGSGEDANGAQANVLMGEAGERATAGLDMNLGNAMVAAENQYKGLDPASVPMDQQLSVYQAMTGPNAGYDAATRAAIANEGNAALNAQEAAARDQITNAMARTGSPLGAYGAIADVSQNIGNQRSAQARQNQILFANEQQRQKEAGASGLGANAGLALGRENAAMQDFLTAQNQRIAQQQTATNQANQFINDDTARRLAGLNAAAGQNAQQRAYQQAGGAGLTNLLGSQLGQQNQLYSYLASILGNKQEEASGINTNASNVNIDLNSILGI